MGYSFRVFAVNDDYSVTRISNARFQRCFFDETECLTEYAGKRLQYAFVTVKVAGRTVLEILRMDYAILPFNDEGGLDKDEWLRNSRLAMEMLSSTLYRNEQRGHNVIDANGIFAKKIHDAAFRWIPTKEIEQKIFEMVFFVPSPKPPERRLRLVT